MQHDGTTRHDRADRRSAGENPPAVPRPREEAAPADVPAAAQTTPHGPAGRPDEEDTLPAPADLAAPGSLGDYAELLAALTAYDITGVRPGELDRYLAHGQVPDGVAEDTLVRARRIAERERERLLRLANP